MSEEARTWAERRLLGWSRAVRRRRRLVLGLAPAVTALALWIAVRGLGVNTDTGSLVSDDLDFRRTYREYLDAFPHSQDELIVLIEAETPARADAAAGRLAGELGDDTSAFRSVYRPDGGPYFDRVGLLFRDRAAIEDLAARTAPYADLLVSVETEPTLRGLASALETVAAERAEEAGEPGAVSGPLDLRPVLQLLARSVFEASEGRVTPVPWSALLAGELPGAAERRRTLVLRPRLAYENAVPGRAAMERVRRAARDLGLIERNGVQVRLTGTVAIEAEELDTAVAGVRRTGALAAVAVALILFFALRSPSLILASVATLAAGLAVTSAFAALAVGQLNLISVAFAILYVGLGIDYAIHLCLRYRTHRGAGSSSADAIDRAVVEVGPSLVLSALTTAACFFAFIPTDFTGVSELGLIGGVGMFVSLVATLTLLPASLAAFPPSRRSEARTRGIPWLRSAMRGRGTPILVVAVIATALAATVLPRSRFDANPLDLRDPESESMSAYRALLEDPASRPLTVNLLVADTAAARDTVRKLLALPEVATVRTLGSFVPGDQDAKLEALSGLELPAPPARSALDESPDVARFRAAVTALRWKATPEERTAVRQLEAALRRWERRAAGWSGPRRDRQARALETVLLGGLPDQVERLRAVTRSGPVSVADLPDDLRERWIAADGRHRIEIVPRDALLGTAELRAFVEAVTAVVPDATGEAVSQLGTGRVAVAAFRLALLGAGAVTALLLLALTRSALAAALVVVPLAMAAAWTGALTVWLDAPFNFANVIALPLLLGVGVDNGIHVVHQVRSVPGGRGPLASSTGRAVLFASLTTIASFGNLAFSVHVGMASMGRLLTLGMICVLLATLVVLPAALDLRGVQRRLGCGDVAGGYENGAESPPRS